MAGLPPEVIATDRALRRRQQEQPDAPPMTPAEVEALVAEMAEAEKRSQEREFKRVKRQTEATTALRAWARAHKARDTVIRTAAEAGVSVHQIHRITGIARTTIMRILT